MSLDKPFTKRLVHKYGGSSLASIEKLQAVARSLVARHAEGYELVVVVSAMGKSTDELLSMAAQICPTPSRRELDMLVTAGERISMALLSMAINALGTEARSFTGSQSGVITEDAHQGARIIAVRPYRIEACLASGKIAIVAGYQGVSEQNKEVTTLGRGGSDTSAVALAAALNAQSCEIYSDVDGVYSADPRVCKQAKHLAQLSYASVISMGESGASVLNAEAMAFAKKAGIEVCARKTLDTTETKRETLISHTPGHLPKFLAVISYSDALQLQGNYAHLLNAFSRLQNAGAELLLGFSSHHLSPTNMQDEARTETITIGLKGVAEAMATQNLVATAEKLVSMPESFEIKAVALISLIGHWSAETITLVEKERAKNQTIEIAALEPRRIRFLCKPKDVSFWVQRLHALFIE